MANTGPSARTANSLSVTTVAISMMTSESGLRPVISRSIQIRLSELGIGRQFSVISPGAAPMDTTFDALVIAAYGRHLLVRDKAGAERKARPFGRSMILVCG